MGFVLHLTDSDPIACARIGAALRAGAAVGGVSAAAVLIGGSDDERAARRAGLLTFDRLHPPGGRASLARGSLRRYCALRGWPRVIVCWGEEAWRLAAAACPATPRVVVVDRPPRPRLGRDPLTAAVAIFADEAVAGAWSGEAGPNGRAKADQTIVRLPPASPGVVGGEHDARSRWTNERDALVIGLVGAPLGGGDAGLLGFAVGALALAGEQVVAVSPAGAPGSMRALRTADRSGRWRVLTDDLAPAGRIESLDVALWAPARPQAGCFEHPIGLRRALSAGVPSVAVQSPQTRGLVEDGAQLRLVGSDRVSVTRGLLEAVQARRIKRCAGAACDPAEWRGWVEALDRAAASAAQAPLG